MINSQPAIKSTTAGFTLIELVMVIVLIGILAGVASIFITGPIDAFVDTNRRAELVDIAETALHRMTRETRQALPNSVRLANNGSRFAIEFLRTSTGGRYRAQTATAGVSDPLNFTVNTDSFDILGGLPAFNLVDTAGGTGRAACLNNTVDCIVIFNTGTSATDFNAYTGNNIAAITAISNTSLTFNNTDVAGWRFPSASPVQRFFVVDTPMSFVCDNATGELWLYQNYAMQNVQPVTAASFGAGGAMLANQLANCSINTFQYNSGAGQRYGLVIFRITIAATDGSNEQISLLQQVHVLNAP